VRSTLLTPSAPGSSKPAERRAVADVDDRAVRVHTGPMAMSFAFTQSSGKAQTYADKVLEAAQLGGTTSEGLTVDQSIELAKVHALLTLATAVAELRDNR
jgi:hypothetical protein